jgi:hypothetical protein
MEKDLFLILKTQYFREIEAGTKTSEYRLATDYWLRRLTSIDWQFVTFQLGYAAHASRLRKKIVRIDLVTIEHELFGNQPVEVFEIKIADIV